MKHLRRLRPLTITAWCLMIGGVAMTTISSIMIETNEVSFFSDAFTTYLLVSIAGIVIALTGLLTGAIYWTATWIQNRQKGDQP